MLSSVLFFAMGNASIKYLVTSKISANGSQPGILIFQYLKSIASDASLLAAQLLSDALLQNMA